MKRAIIAMMLAGPAVALADEPAPTPAEIKEANKHFEVGKKLIQQQKFDGAIGELEAAYRLDPRAEHLYNLGVAHHLDGHDEIAMQYYRLYLVDNPTGKAARDATKYLASLQAKLDGGRAEKSKQFDAEIQTKLVERAAAEAKSAAALDLEAKAIEDKTTALATTVTAADAEQVVFQREIADARARTARATKLARRWERSARAAPSGAGRERRLLGTLLLAASAATFTSGALDLMNGENGGLEQGEANTQLIVGSSALALGLGFYIWGELAATSPRPSSAFEKLRVAPVVGPHTTALVLSTRF